MSLTGTLACTFLPIESPPIIVGGGITVTFSGTLGELSGSATVSGSYDESKANLGNISGNISGTIGNSGLSATAQWGPDYCNVNLVGSANISNVTLSGDIDYSYNQLVLQPILTVETIVFSLSFNAKSGRIHMYALWS